MATSIISAEYLEEALEFVAELEENGYKCSFGSYGSSVDPRDPPNVYVEAGKASVFPMDAGSDWHVFSGGDVEKNDVVFIATFEIDIKSVTHMIDAATGKTYEIVRARDFKPDGITGIFQEFQAR